MISLFLRQISSHYEEIMDTDPDCEQAPELCAILPSVWPAELVNTDAESKCATLAGLHVYPVSDLAKLIGCWLLPYIHCKHKGVVSM